MSDAYAMTPAELAEWDRRTAHDRPDDEAIRDPLWRLRWLYRCTDSDGRDVPYIPTPEQRLIVWCLHGRGWRRLLIPKSRQLGCSLTLCLYALDQVLFRSGFRAAWVDRTLEAAQEKVRGKIKFAWDRLPERLRESLKVVADSTTEFSVIEEANPTAPASAFAADVSFRGATCELLIVSEWASIQAKDRARSKEIASGALPAAERAKDGVIVVESTWGSAGLDGELGPLVREALDVPEDQKSSRSWRILFLAWHSSPLYRQAHGYIDPDAASYFKSLEIAGVTLTHEQRLWYSEKRRSLGPRAVKSEFPSLAAECWTTAPENSILSPWIEKARASGRVLNFEPDGRALVHTAWDLGAPQNTVVGFFQIVGPEIRILDVELERDVTLVDRVAGILGRGWPLGQHFIPHDGGSRSATGKNFSDELSALLPGVRVLSRANDIWTSIDGLRSLLPRMVFRVPACAKGLEYLERYSAITETSTGMARDVPLHDKYSHAADGLRQVSTAILAGLVHGGDSVTGQSRARHFSPSVLATQPQGWMPQQSFDADPPEPRRAVIGARRPW